MLNKKPLLKILIIVLFASVSLSCSDTNNVLDKQLQTGDSYFSIVYNKRFAERFKLSAQSEVKLDEGLQAVAIEIRRINYDYQCLLHFYVDDTIDIYMPSDGDYFYHKEESEQFFIRAYNDPDQKWNSDTLDLNMSKILYIADDIDVSKGKWSNGLSYDKVHRSFLPNLSVASTKVFCFLLEKSFLPAKIRIQNNTAKNYLTENDSIDAPKHRENFYEFAIPEKLINNAEPYMKIAIDKVTERLNRLY